MSYIDRLIAINYPDYMALNLCLSSRNTKALETFVREEEEKYHAMCKQVVKEALG